MVCLWNWDLVCFRPSTYKITISVIIKYRLKNMFNIIYLTLKSPTLTAICSLWNLESHESSSSGYFACSFSHRISHIERRNTLLLLSSSGIEPKFLPSINWSRLPDFPNLFLQDSPAWVESYCLKSGDFSLWLCWRRRWKSTVDWDRRMGSTWVGIDRDLKGGSSLF